MRALFIYTILFLSAFTSTNAQWGNSKKIKGNGTMTTTERKTSDYEGIVVRGSLNVQLVSGTEGNITIKSESNLAEYIITEIEYGSLQIYVKKGYYLKPSYGKKLLVIVPFEDISKVSLSGSGDITSDAIIETTDFKAKVSGSGDVQLSVKTKNLESTVSGSGNLKLKGTSEMISCTVTGSGGIEAFDVNAKEASAKITGSGDIKVTATDAIKGRITGSGDIEYKGNPEREDKKATGSGDISPRHNVEKG